MPEPSPLRAAVLADLYRLLERPREIPQPRPFDVGYLEGPILTPIEGLPEARQIYNFEGVIDLEALTDVVLLWILERRPA